MDPAHYPGRILPNIYQRRPPQSTGTIGRGHYSYRSGERFRGDLVMLATACEFGRPDLNQRGLFFIGFIIRIVGEFFAGKDGESEAVRSMF